MRRHPHRFVFVGILFLMILFVGWMQLQINSNPSPTIPPVVPLISNPTTPTTPEPAYRNVMPSYIPPPLTPNTVEFPATCIEGKCVHVQLAITEAEKQRGLMGVTSLSDTKGMLFVWDEEGQYPFWMKDTLIPLDMIWIDAQNKVVDFTTMQPCEADPCPVYSPSANAQYVLETRAGLMEEWGITRGSEAQLLIPAVN